MPETLKMGLKLLLITVIATFALALTQMITQEPIKAQAEKAGNEARAVVLEGAEKFVPLQIVDDGAYPNIMEVHEGLINGSLKGYTIQAVNRGYGGNIIAIIGIDESGSVSGVRIAQHAETPGLGAKIQQPDYYAQYDGKPATGLLDDESISSISGATISSSAVTGAVNYAIDYYQAELASGGGNQ